MPKPRFMETLVNVPTSLIFDNGLQASAKVLWAVKRGMEENGEVNSENATFLCTMVSRSGQSPNTVRHGLVQLEASGWVTRTYHDGRHRIQTVCRRRHPSVAVPMDLLVDCRLRDNTKLTFVVIQGLCGSSRKIRRPFYTTLARMLGFNRKTVKRAVRLLKETGWIKVAEGDPPGITTWEVRNPFAQKRSAEATDLEVRLNTARFTGEQLMREFLTLLIDSDEYADSARPGWLTYPRTGMQLEYDRWYYMHGVAFEFNGPQHYQTTEDYPSEQQLREQKTRDLVKLARSVQHGVNLITIVASDLSLEAMLRKVQGLGLPLRNLTGKEHLLEALESRAVDYRNAPRGEGEQPRPS